MPPFTISPIQIVHRALPTSPRQPLTITLTRTLNITRTFMSSAPNPRPAPAVPASAWDTHMHVADPSRFPVSASATYAPHAALLTSAQTHASSIGVPNLVFVQPSTYGFDNSCLLDGLRTVGPRHGRGVVVFDPDAGATPLEQLREWHAQGVRGVRVNLKSVGKKLGVAEMADVLGRHAEAIRPLRTWVLQIYADLAQLRGLADLMPRLGVKVVVDHLGSPGPELFEEGERAKSEDWADFKRFLETEGGYTKVSGPYRLSKDPEYRDLEGVVKELLTVRGGKAVVWASDWPHTRFEGTNVRPWVDRCLEWCGEDDGLRERLFRDNAKALFDIDE